ncbi:MAG: hypothetical protein SVY41_02740 [Candidatus Nanohaloarchaea archaeon]|nr:hypothetical protein [Candidatus Nanohaloarchaea archaeon]
MKRAFIGLFGMVFGGILLVPSFLIGKTFGGQGAVSTNPAILAIQGIGAALLIGTPLLYWVILPVAERHRLKKR